ncbi:MAG TPA: hypothetical protein VOA41_18950 [Candidatus Dormibacteraeota bacterium]|nr:hypothetical protein [Candidatus Dormibacteraeota bacterium]
MAFMPQFAPIVVLMFLGTCGALALAGLAAPYFNNLVFEVPAAVHHPRLLITDQEPVTRLLIGHEASPLHKKIWFDLGSPI